MTGSSKLALSCLIALGAFMLVRHGVTALRPARPVDMPSSSYFVQSGYDLARNEPTGEWIACRDDAEEAADFCRVTDARGSVIFQGDFLPMRERGPIPVSQLRIAGETDRSLWVQGPAENGPVPVIPLANGDVLVPSDDTYALSVRWRQNPDELRRLQGE
jgi:hypothetical protein